MTWGSRGTRVLTYPHVFKCHIWFCNIARNLLTGAFYVGNFREWSQSSLVMSSSQQPPATPSNPQQPPATHPFTHPSQIPSGILDSPRGVFHGRSLDRRQMQDRCLRSLATHLEAAPDEFIMARFTLQQILDDLLGPLRRADSSEIVEIFYECANLVLDIVDSRGIFASCYAIVTPSLAASALQGLLEAVGQHRGGLQEKMLQRLSKEFCQKAAGLIYSLCFLCVSQHGFYLSMRFLPLFCISIRVELLFGKMFTDLICHPPAWGWGTSMPSPALQQLDAMDGRTDGSRHQQPALPLILCLARFRHCPLGAATGAREAFAGLATECCTGEGEAGETGEGVQVQEHGQSH